MAQLTPLPNPTGPRADSIPVPEPTVTLQPLVMRWPNRLGVYSPSAMRPARTLGYHEFLSRYADQAKRIRVCFEETACRQTLLRRSQWVTAYSVGLEGWHAVVAITER